MNKRPEYYINEEKGIIICKIINCHFDAIEVIQQKSDILDEGMFCVPTELMISDSFKGIAKVQNGDVFNLDFGKKLAYKKAIAKRSIAINKKVKFVVKNYKKIIGNVFSQLDKLVAITDSRVEKSLTILEEVLEEVK